MHWRDGCSTVKAFGRESGENIWSMVGQELAGGIEFGPSGQAFR
jgi:hypothetical protein